MAHRQNRELRHRPVRRMSAALNPAPRAVICPAPGMKSRMMPRGLTCLMLLLLIATPALAELQVLYYANRSVKTRVATTTSEKGEVLRHGLFQRFYPDGKPHVQGSYRFNRRSGVWSWWDQEGLLMRRVRYDGDFQELLFGKNFNSSKTVFSNTAGRKTAQGLLKHDKGHGEWRYWYNTGEIKAKGRFVTGKPDGRWVMYYRDGQIKTVKEYQLGILHGQFMQAFSGGQEKIKGRMELGMKVGWWRYYFADGQIKSEGLYLNDKEDGEWRFWAKDGEHVATVRYRSGKVLKVLPMAPLPSGEPRGDPVVPLRDQLLDVNPGVFDGDDKPIQQKYYDAKATPLPEKGRRWKPLRRPVFRGSPQRGSAFQ